MKRRICFFIALFLIVSCRAQNWSTVGQGLNDDVRCFFADTVTNILYAGGSFWQSHGVMMNSISQYSNQSWDSLKTGTDNCSTTSSCFPVVSICKFNGAIYAAGMFPGMSGVPNTKGIAKWTGSSWQSIGGCDGVVWRLINYNNALYAMGGYDSIGGIQAFSIAKFDGIGWVPVADTLFKNEIISCGGVYQGELYVGGSFHFSSLGIDCIARYNGSTWNSPGITGLANGMASVSAFEVFQNKLYVAGYFSQVSGAIGNGMIVWNGITWSSVGNGLTHSSGFTPNVNALCVHYGKLFVAGGFSMAGGISANCLASWDGALWCGYGIPALTNDIEALTSFNDTLYIGGGFIDLEGDTTTDYIAKWTAGNYTDTCGVISTGIAESETSSFSVFPNPANDQLTIQLNEDFSKNSSLQILNSLGQIVLEQELSAGEKEVVIDIASLSEGMYFFSIANETAVVSQKLLIQR